MFLLIFLKNFFNLELTALSSRNGRAIATFLNFYVSHGKARKFLRNGEIKLLCR